MPEPINPNPGVANPNPAPTPQDPPGGGTPPAPPTPGANPPGAPGTPQPDPNVGDKTVPITALHEERDKRQALQAQLDMLKTALGDKVSYDAYGNPVPIAQDQPSAGPNQELEELWQNDPRKAMQTEQMMALQWYDRVNMEVNKQKAECMTKHSDYAKYAPAVDNYLARLPIQQRETKGIVELAYNAVRGQDFDNLKQTWQNEMIEKIKRGEQIQGLGPGTQTFSATPKEGDLTPDQLKAATAMNMTPEEYKKHIK